MKLEMINKTKWDTATLRLLCKQVIKYAGSHKQHKITIATSRKRWSNYSGRASVNGSWIWMYVPKITKKVCIAGIDGSKQIKEATTQFDVNTFALILEHEIQHNLGDVDKDLRVDWKKQIDCVKDIVVEPTTIIKETVDEKLQKRKLKYEKKLLELKRKENRTKKLIKKYESRLKRINTRCKNGKNND